MLFKEETFQIIGGAMRVHQKLGCGFTEKVYQDALEVEFHKRNIPYVREQPLHVVYDDVQLKSEFIPDFVCYDKIIVELKAVKEIEDLHRSQVMNYGRVGKKRVALLINFGEMSLKYERYYIRNQS